MQLVGCQDQKSQTLDEFYTEISLHDGFYHNVGISMLDLINRLREHTDNRQAFGLTSHERLCLLSEDSWQSPWYIIIAAHDRHLYSIQFLMPEQEAPWPDAYVSGEAHSLDEAVEMILIGMEKSAGWKVQRGMSQQGKHINIEYFEEGSIDTPLVQIYGNDPAGVEKLRWALDNLVNDIVDNVAIHELPGFMSVGECQLFAEVDRDDLGVWRSKNDEPAFICSQRKETWIEVINKLKLFTDPHTYIYSGGCFQYLTDPTQHSRINLLISTRRGW